MLKLFLHAIGKDSDVFRSILIILRELRNIIQPAVPSSLLTYKIDIPRIRTTVETSKPKSSTRYGPVLHCYKRILYYLQTFYAQKF
jgi:hypothetical protein